MTSEGNNYEIRITIKVFPHYTYNSIDIKTVKWKYYSGIYIYYFRNKQ